MKTVGPTLLLLLSLGAPPSASSPRPFSLAEESAELRPQSETSPPDAAVRPASRRRTQWLMFTARWCAACQAARSDFEAWLQRSGWRVDAAPDAHVRIIDADERPDLVQSLDVRVYPTFILMRGETELSRMEGYPGKWELVRRYQDAVRDAGPIVSAVTMGTLKGARQNIADVISLFRPLLGEGGTMTLRIERSGDSNVFVPLGDRLSLRASDPLEMTYTLENDVLTCRFGEPYPRGRITLGVPVEQAISAVTLSVSEVVIELPRAPDIRLTVEP